MRHSGRKSRICSSVTRSIHPSPSACWAVLATVMIHCVLLPGGLSADDLEFDPGVAFDEVWTSVRDQFWDPALGGVDWQTQREQLRPRATACTTHDAFADVINEMLGSLGTSHTHYYPATDPRRYQLLGIFTAVAPDDQPDLFTYDGIGVATVTIDQKVFVSAVYDGLPAAQTGLLYGDEIVSVDSLPFRPFHSFQGKAGQVVQVVVRREPDSDRTLTLQIPVVRINGRTMFETALQASARVIPHGSLRIGYVHVWCYAGRKYQDLLEEMVLWGDLSECHALVLDLRDGWGGASLDYVNLFRKPVAQVESQSRSGQMNYTGVWGKPVSLLVNRGTTSGKELFTFAFRKLQLGEVVGTRTAGAVVGGRCMLMGNSDVLYVAVADVKADGQRLEGIGVEPTVVVARPLAYAGGKDPPLDKAVERLVDQIHRSEQTDPQSSEHGN